ncbi:class I SAM-dependent methyltransferase [Bacillus sp. 165]|uniref:class I SAM-dependent DNA methyltransferase n=1 Tax=Bacillus sp. 165 TaxID=1529117 RepID=UPI001ADB73EB|nr:class I SAM-dependent methyltransferase [Bacillus sp. 165]MBO9129573.1 class I SAM-dependent methyltransferase [Bacillus sp. 165]
MSYEQFAFLYDELMSDVPYEKWVDFVEQQLQKQQVRAHKILDLACGTGNITLPLAKKGYTITGADLSEDMLAVAQQKATGEGLSIPFYQQDMTELELPERFDCITIFCDSLNYVLEEQGVQRTFQRVYEHLNTGGLFLFDVHSVYKVNEVFINETFAVNEDSVALIWNCFPGELPNSVEHELTFFTQDIEKDMYRRFDEFHVQRTYSIQELKDWLEEAGFSVQSITDGFEQTEVFDTTERIFFAAKK